MSHVRSKSPGHKYELLNMEDPHRTDPQEVLFIRKEPVEDGSEELRTVHNGTTNEAVLEMMIDRLEYLNKKLPSKNNQKAIKHLRSALKELNKRTVAREEAGVEGTHAPLEESDTEEPAAEGFSPDDPIPEEMPWDSYLKKNELETIGDVQEAIERPDFTELKYMNADREEDIRDWLGENL